MEDTESLVTKSWFVLRTKPFNFYLTPLYWFILWHDTRQLYGDQIYHRIHCLCFQLELYTLSARGRSGRKYRESLKKSGEWNPDRELKINKEAFLRDAKKA